MSFSTAGIDQTYAGVFCAFNEFIAQRPDFRLLHRSYFPIAQRG